MQLQNASNFASLTASDRCSQLWTPLLAPIFRSSHSDTFAPPCYARMVFRCPGTLCTDAQPTGPRQKNTDSSIPDVPCPHGKHRLSVYWRAQRASRFGKSRSWLWGTPLHTPPRWLFGDAGAGIMRRKRQDHLQRRRRASISGAREAMNLSSSCSDCRLHPTPHG